ncbi:MAG: D-arabinono-1,4-lactone oxidase [Bacteroidota bacterium]
MKIVGRILTFIFVLIFQKDKLPDFFESLDDWLTNHCTREQRDRYVNRINWLFGLWIFREPLEFFLNRATKNERMDLNVEAYHERKQREIPEREYRERWENWIGNNWAEPLAYKFPGNSPYKDVLAELEKLKEYDFQSLKILQGIVKQAEADGHKVRCVASGHALSDIAKTNDILISTKRFTAPQRRPKDVIKEAYKDGYKATFRVDGKDIEEDRFLFETGAGTLVVDLNQILEKEGLALLNQGGSDVQGVFGGVSTSTHGSGVNIGPYPSFVKSMVMITSEGKTYRIEPTDGVTDPTKYAASDDFKVHGIELVQNDKDFHAALVNMGCMGIVYSAIIEVRSGYRLYEERRLMDWDELKAEMASGDLQTFLEKNRHFEISVNPYRLNEEGKIDSNGKRKCLVMTRNYTDSTVPIPVDGKGEKFQRNYFSSFISGISVAGTISSWLFNRKPENMPKMINNSLLRLEDHKDNGGGFLNKSYKVLNQGLRELKFFGYAIEIGFPLDKAFDAVDRMFEIAEKAAKDRQYHPAPISLRFVEESPAFLSMMYKRKSCMVEVVSLKGVTGGMDILERVEREMAEFDGRPHWGLFLTQLNEDRLAELYPELESWKEIHRKYNKGTFDNAFTERMGF